jgi:2-polyprenyl-6-methoxyphenol hydroxylase-like FAD-dependent oxidoreductase
LVFEELKSLGDIISFGPNAGRIFRRWSNGKIADRLKPLSINLESHGFKIHKWTGELVHTQIAHNPDPDAPVFNGHRGELHTVVFNYARDELGIPIHLGQRVMEYFEDGNQAGIVLESGIKVNPYRPSIWLFDSFH